MGQRVINLLWWYWDRPTTVAQTGGYFRKLFKGFRGFTQGDPPFPMILNVVADSMIWHWMKVVAATEAGDDGFGRAV